MPRHPRQQAEILQRGDLVAGDIVAHAARKADDCEGLEALGMDASKDLVALQMGLFKEED